MKRILAACLLALVLLGCDDKKEPYDGQFAGRQYKSAEDIVILFNAFQAECVITPDHIIRHLSAMGQPLPSIAYSDDEAGTIVAGSTTITYTPADTTVLYIGGEAFSEL